MEGGNTGAKTDGRSASSLAEERSSQSALSESPIHNSNGNDLTKQTHAIHKPTLEQLHANVMRTTLWEHEIQFLWKTMLAHEIADGSISLEECLKRSNESNDEAFHALIAILACLLEKTDCSTGALFTAEHLENFATELSAVVGKKVDPFKATPNMQSLKSYWDLLDSQMKQNFVFEMVRGMQLTVSNVAELLHSLQNESNKRIIEQLQTIQNHAMHTEWQNEMATQLVDDFDQFINLFPFDKYFQHGSQDKKMEYLEITKTTKTVITILQECTRLGKQLQTVAKEMEKGHEKVTSLAQKLKTAEEEKRKEQEKVASLEEKLKMSEKAKEKTQAENQSLQHELALTKEKLEGNRRVVKEREATLEATQMALNQAIELKEEKERTIKMLEKAVNHHLTQFMDSLRFLHGRVASGDGFLQYISKEMERNGVEMARISEQLETLQLNHGLLEKIHELLTGQKNMQNSDTPSIINTPELLLTRRSTTLNK